MVRKTTETLRRQWTLLRAVPAYPNWRATRDLHERMRDESYEVNIRTIQRDLDWLSGYFPLSSEMRGKTLYWQWMKDAPGLEIPAMSRSTALVFQLVDQYLRQLMPGNVLNLLAPYMERASVVLKESNLSNWNERVAYLERGPQLTPPEVDERIRDVVYSALLKGLCFEVEYVSRYEIESSIYPVNPLGIVLREGVLYVVCTLRGYTDIRQLALHRIQAAKLLDEEARTIEGFSLQKYIREEIAFGYPESSRPIRLKAVFDEGAAFHLTERKLSEDQKIKKLSNGNCSLTATVANTAELRWWLLGFGDGVEVVAPKKLREEFRKMAGNMAQIYS